MFGDAIEIIVIMLGVAILTALICWLIWRNRYRSLYAQYTQKVKDYDELNATYLKLGKEHEGLTAKFADLSAKVSGLEGQVSTLTRDLEACKKARLDLEGKLRDLATERISLLAKLSKEEARFDVANAQAITLGGFKTKFDQIGPKLKVIITENAELKVALAKESDRFDAANAQALKLGAFKTKYDQVEPALKEMADENIRLKAELESLKNQSTSPAPSTRGMGMAPSTRSMAPAPEPEVSESEQDLILSRIRANTAKINFDRIGTAGESDKDDLKIIKGIGPFIEKKLNALNIFTFRQIANFTEEDEDLVNESIEFFPGRIRRDKWVPQARGLMDGGAKAVKEATALKRVSERAQEINFDRIGTAREEDKDDLKIVKGIGPFLERKLNSIGIFTFRQIANFTLEDEDKVNEVIEFFPGRIRRDEWSKQATVLADEKEG